DMACHTLSIEDRLDRLLIEVARRTHGARYERGAQPGFPRAAAHAIAEVLELSGEKCRRRRPPVRHIPINIPENLMRTQGVRHDVVTTDPHLRRAKHEVVVRGHCGADIHELVRGVELQLREQLCGVACAARGGHDALVEGILIRLSCRCPGQPTWYREVGDL